MRGHHEVRTSTGWSCACGIPLADTRRLSRPMMKRHRDSLQSFTSWDLIEEDVIPLLQSGEKPDIIVQRVGMSASAIARAAYRAGRKDIARPFTAIQSREAYYRRKERNRVTRGEAG